MTACLPLRENSSTKHKFQETVTAYLLSVGQHWINKCYLSGNFPSQGEVVEWLAARVDEDFRGQWDETLSGRPATHRLVRSRLVSKFDKLATYMLRTWDPEYIQKRSLGGAAGGRYSRRDGVRKGRSPRWSEGDLAPFWKLPVRGRSKACMDVTGMSSATYYRLAKLMPAFLEEQAKREAQSAVTLDWVEWMLEVGDLDHTISENELTELVGPGWTALRADDLVGRITKYGTEPDRRLAGDPSASAPTPDRCPAGGSTQCAAAGEGTLHGSGGPDRDGDGTRPGHGAAELTGGGPAVGSPELDRGTGDPRPADDLRRHAVVPHRAERPRQDRSRGVRRPDHVGILGHRDPGDGRPGRWTGCSDRVPAPARGDAHVSQRAGREPSGPGRDVLHGLGGVPGASGRVPP